MPFSKYSPKQKRLAAAAKPRNKITRADFTALNKKKKKKKTRRARILSYCANRLPATKGA